MRIHKIISDRFFETVEGGFAIPRDDAAPEISEDGPGFAKVVKNGHAGSAIDLDFEDAFTRNGCVRQALPNTSLYFPQTHVPQLCGQVLPGETWFAGAFLGSPNGPVAPPSPPTPEDLQDLLSGTAPVKGLKFTEATFTR